MTSRTLVYVLCFCSGLAGLTYEVIWQRVLVVIVGNAATATTAVLAAVMLGLGLGSLLAARHADRTEPLRAYGAIEVALGVLALTVPLGARLAGAVTPGWLLGEDPGVGSFVVRFLIAGVVVLAPATLMGATVPFLARFAALGFRGPGDAVGPSAGLVYGLNTAGAALGCVLTGYVLLGRFGVFWTGAAAAGVDVGIGLIALRLATRLRATEGEGAGLATEDRPLDPSERSHALPPWFVLVLAGVGGASVLALEGLWTRMLRIVFGHDVHAFASMLAAVLVGLALGSGLFALLPLRIRRSRLFVPGVLTALGLGEVISLAVVGRLYLERGLDIFEVGASFAITRSHEQGLVLQALFTSALVLWTAMAAGALLPALCAGFRPAAAGAVQGTGRRVGQVLAANTAGALVGAVLPIAVLVPYLGLQRSFVAVAALAVGAAALCLAAARGLPWTVRALGCFLIVLAFGLAATTVPADLPRQVLARKIGPHHLRFLMYEEGATGTVAVVENRLNRERQVFINGVNEVTTRLVHDQSFKLLGHLGLLMHPDPREVLVICLGAGLSAGAVATHDVESIRVVDLERSVVHAARFFDDLNNGVLEDPRVDVSIEDGRHHLRTTTNRYDVIVVDSTHPRAVDSWLLYTREFYALARARLDREGYLVQWVPLHGLSVDEFRIIVHTFLSEFPQGSLWVNAGYERYGQAAYALLLGPRGRGDIDRGNLAHRLAAPAIRADLLPWGLHSVPEVLECFVAGPRALRRWTGHLPMNTDDLPWTQFVTEYSRATPMTAARLLEVREPVSAYLEPTIDAAESELASELRRRYLAQGFIFAGQLERAIEVCGLTCDKPPQFALAADQGPPYFVALRQRYEADPERMLEIASSLTGLGQVDEAVTTLERAVQVHRSDARLWLNLGILLASRGDVDEARSAFRASLAHNPDLALARINLGLLEVRAGRHAEGLVDLERAVVIDPSLSEAHAALGFGLFESDEPERAEHHLLQALALDPRNHDARITLGRLRLGQGRDADALAIFQVAHRLFPYDGDAAFNLGLALLRTEQPASAVTVLEAAVRIDPTDHEAVALLRAARTTASLMPQ